MIKTEFMLSNRLKVLLFQIRTAILQLKEWNNNVQSSDDYYCSPDGMKDLAASCMLIEAIGESIKQIDKITEGNLLAKRPEIPWKDVIGIRNHIAHGYFDIDGDMVFDVVKNDLDSLLEAIEYFIENLTVEK
ncbi:HepT-like ribonuclease domain-containing protein [uncultured Prevotella sp.]|uniref:HepT-like ribonuclease domain-containing protein n=1 Tax=uncultured Prevotella sp. TaxID=159272 RepID=UPI002632728E|nr:HepT-like ribonuclease domain-containing protein [uncultured Prevotella sp.]